MTRQDAIDILVGVIATNSEEENEALDMAIEALEQEPTAEYSSDVISRQAAIDAVKEAYENDEMFDGYEYRLQELPSAHPFTEEQIQTMQELESAQVEKAYELGKADRPTGHWIYHPEWEYDGGCGYECSVCNMGSDVDYNFCMRCGAEMRGKQNE